MIKSEHLENLSTFKTPGGFRYFYFAKVSEIYLPYTYSIHVFPKNIKSIHQVLNDMIYSDYSTKKTILEAHLLDMFLMSYISDTHLRLIYGPPIYSIHVYTSK